MSVSLCSDVMSLISEFVEDDFTFQFVNKSSYKNIKFNNQMFISACENGNLDTAKWLMQFNPKVNLTAFKRACKYGHLDVAMWLSSIHKVNIQSDEYLIEACKFNQLNIIRWLVQFRSSIDTVSKYLCMNGYNSVNKKLTEIFNSK